MTIVLILSILILVTIAIWQITKIFELSQPAKINDSQIADNDDNNTQGKLMFEFCDFEISKDGRENVIKHRIYLLFVFTLL